MLLRVAFTAQDVANTRFAVSPLWEIVAAVRVLKAPREHPMHRGWTDQVLPRLARSELDWRILADLVPVPTRRIPAFVCPPPAMSSPSLDVELATLRATPAGRVRADFDDMAELDSPRLAVLRDDPAAGLAQLADVIASLWDVAFAPYWPRIASLLEGDMLYRARVLVEGGPRRLFDDLDPDTTWDRDTLYVTRRRIGADARLDGRGLLLVPSVFTYPRIFSITSPDWQPTLRYPPRGIATLWQAQPSRTPDALAAVVGRSRARLLMELSSPAATRDLAVRTGMSAGGVSQHLTALRAAGLVSAHRTGRLVLYARTGVAESLVRGG